MVAATGFVSEYRFGKLKSAVFRQTIKETPCTLNYLAAGGTLFKFHHRNGVDATELTSRRNTGLCTKNTINSVS